MSWNKEKFRETYNRARQKAYAQKLFDKDSGYEAVYDDHCDVGHDYECTFCNPPMEFIMMGRLGILLWRLRLKSAEKLIELY